MNEKKIQSHPLQRAYSEKLSSSTTTRKSQWLNTRSFVAHAKLLVETATLQDCCPLPTGPSLSGCSEPVSPPLCPLQGWEWVSGSALDSSLCPSRTPASILQLFSHKSLICVILPSGSHCIWTTGWTTEAEAKWVWGVIPPLIFRGIVLAWLQPSTENQNFSVCLSLSLWILIAALFSFQTQVMLPCC